MQLCSDIKLTVSEKVMLIKLIIEDFANTGVRKCAGVGKVCVTYFEVLS